MYQTLTIKFIESQGRHGVNGVNLSQLEENESCCPLQDNSGRGIDYLLLSDPIKLITLTPGWSHLGVELPAEAAAPH